MLQDSWRLYFRRTVQMDLLSQKFNPPFLNLCNSFKRVIMPYFFTCDPIVVYASSSHRNLCCCDFARLACWSGSKSLLDAWLCKSLFMLSERFQVKCAFFGGKKKGKKFVDVLHNLNLSFTVDYDIWMYLPGLLSTSVEPNRQIASGSRRKQRRDGPYDRAMVKCR